MYSFIVTLVIVIVIVDTFMFGLFMSGYTTLPCGFIVTLVTAIMDTFMFGLCMSG